MSRRLPLSLPAPEQLVQHVNKFNLTTREKLAVAITGAFGVVMGLSWNETVKLFVERILGTLGIVNGSGLWLRFAGSVLTTLIAVLVILVFSRWAKKEDETADARKTAAAKANHKLTAFGAPAQKPEEKPKA